MRAYAKDANGTGAARRAGYAPVSASKQGARLRQNPEVAAALERREAVREQRLRITADRVLEEFARIAFADIRDYATWGPDGVSLRPVEEIAADASAAIAEISGHGAAPRLKLHDKKAALNALARHLGIFDAAPPASDAKVALDEAALLRAKLMERIAALAAAPPTKPANGEDA